MSSTTMRFAACTVAAYLRDGRRRGASFACVSRPWQPINGHLSGQDIPERNP